MINHELLRDDYTLEQAFILQKKYSDYLKEHSEKKYHLDNLEQFRRIVGVDISYFKKNGVEWGVACAIFYDRIEKKKLNKYFESSIIRFPYKAGFLGFRENSLIAKAIMKSSERPDVIMCDGHGIIHPLAFGEAVHLGFALDIPTMGVAKTPFIGFSDWKSIKKEKGNKLPIWLKNPKECINSDNKIIGYSICLSNNRRPVFISIGYKMTIDLALTIALETTKYNKQPEPLFLSDKFSKAKIKEFK